MKLHLLMPLLLVFGCSKLPIKKTEEILHPSLEGAKAEAKRYYSVTGAENVLRKTSAATLAVWIRPRKDSKYPMDLIAVSVGGKENGPKASRASLRIHPGGRLFAVARAMDSEPQQNAESESVIKEGKWQHVALVIDYADNKIEFYHDGNLIGSKGRVRFKARRTANTPSRSITIGAEDDGTAFHYTGELKHAGVWSRPLSQDEIKKLIEQFTTNLR